MTAKRVDLLLRSLTSSRTSLLILTTLFLHRQQVQATFGLGGFGGGCSCGPPVICPPEPVCAPSPIIVAPPTPIVPGPIQVPTFSGGSCCGGGDCVGGFGGYYSPSFPCASCRRNRRFGQWIKLKERRRSIRHKRHTNFVNSGGKRRKKPNVDPKCNSEKLKKIMKKAVGMKTSTLKRNIQLLVEKMMGNQYNVLCGMGEFSYTTTTDEYCQTKVMDRTCYVFRRMENRQEENDEEDMIMVEDYDES